MRERKNERKEKRKKGRKEKRKKGRKDERKKEKEKERKKDRDFPTTDQNQVVLSQRVVKTTGQFF